MRWGRPPLPGPFVAAGVVLAAGLVCWMMLAWKGGGGFWLGVVTVAAWIFVICAWGLPVLGAYGPSKEIAALAAGARMETPPPAAARPTSPGTSTSPESSAPLHAHVSTQEAATAAPGDTASAPARAPVTDSPGTAVPSNENVSAANVPASPAMAAPSSRAHGGGVALHGYDEPSLVFYLGGGVTTPGAPGTLAELTAPGAPDILIVSEREGRLLGLLWSSPFTEAGDVRGFNFAKGRWEEVFVWKRSTRE